MAVNSTGISGIDLSFSPTITFSGLASSIDYTSMVSQLVKAEGAAVTQYTNWKQEWTDKITALQTLSTKMQDLQTTVSSMSSLSEFQGKTAASSNTSVLTAEASTTAISGTHQILVNQMAQNEIWVHGGVASSSTVINSSGSAQVFAFKYPDDGTGSGTSVSISVASGATLSDLANAINVSGANPGVTATVLDMGPSYTTDRYRLQIQGKSPGESNHIYIDDSLTTLDGTGGTVNFETASWDGGAATQTAQNAQVRVDGYPSGTWIERSTNNITDVIPGVSLSLVNTSPATPVQVTINDDTGAMQDKIQSLVDSYNAVISYIKEQTKYDSTSDSAGILLGNYAVEIVKSELNGVTTGNAPGFKDPNDTYVNLAQIGITTDTNETSTTFGQLLVDTGLLSKSITDNPQAVSDLMAANFQGVSDDTSGNITYYSSIPGFTQAGIYDVVATVDALGNLTGGTINGHPATISGDTLTGQKGYDEYGLAVKVNLSAPGTFNGTVRIKQGINGAISTKLDDMLNVNSGPVNILINNYKDIIKGIDNKIDLENQRLDAYKSRLTDQFARLETTLSKLNAQSDYINNVLGKSSSSSG